MGIWDADRKIHMQIIYFDNRLDLRLQSTQNDPNMGRVNYHYGIINAIWPGLPRVLDPHFNRPLWLQAHWTPRYSRK